MTDLERLSSRRRIKLTLHSSLVYRLNTYPLIHLGFLHALLNTLALAPLLERFEADHGTLLTAAMFVGRMYGPERPNQIPLLTICC